MSTKDHGISPEQPETVTSRSPLTICGFGSSQSTHVVNRLQCFAKRGHLVHLICSEPRTIDGVNTIVPPLELLRQSRLLRGLDRLSRRTLGRSLPGMTTLSLLLLSLIVRRLQPDLIHIHFAYSFWAWMVATMSRLPIVVSVMGGDILFDEQGTPTPRGRRLTLRLLQRANLVTAKSTALAAELKRFGVSTEKTIVVNWGVDLDIFRPVDATGLRHSLGISPGQPVLLSPRMLQPFYNIELIIAAMPQILAEFPDTILLITEHNAAAGYRDQLHKQIDILGLHHNVRFVGDLAQRDLAAWYCLASVIIAVPPSDGLPQSLLEGMACGTPNLLSKLPGYLEIITHGESGWLVEAEPSAIAAGVVRLLSDPDLCHLISGNGIRIVRQKANFETDVSRVEDRYYTILPGPDCTTGWLTRQQVRIETILDFLTSP